MKLNEAPQLPDGPFFRPQLTELMRQVAKKVNALAAGAFAAKENTATAAPTTGAWATGDFVFNSAPAETGIIASKYIVMGWVCVASGSPGTWKESRTLTGN